MSDLRVLLDMDEVLTDFLGAACRAWGFRLDELIREWPPDEWDVVGTLARRRGVPPEVQRRDFWGPIVAQGEDFWIGLDKTPWADQLLDTVRRLTTDWWIISAPGPCPTSLAGKLRLAARHWGPGVADRVIPTPHKYLFSRVGAVLVDDREQNCHRFERDEDGRPRGGAAILWPAHNNSSRAVPPAHRLPRVSDRLARYARLWGAGLTIHEELVIGGLPAIAGKV